MALPRLLLRLADPAQAWFDRHSPAPRPGRGPAECGAVVYGPGVPGGVRPATDDERAGLAAAAARHRGEQAAREADVRRSWGPQLRRAADELGTKGSTTLQMDGRTVEARVVRFWRGDSVLLTVARGPGGGESRSRISRDPARARPAVLDHLVRAAARG